MQVWYEREASVEPLTFVQRAGELVFVPGYWAHLTMGLGDTLGFSRVMKSSKVAGAAERSGGCWRSAVT